MSLDYVLTKTTTEKLQDLFEKKNRQFDKAQKFRDYLADLDGVEQIRKFSHFNDELGYLIEHINSNLPFDKFIIRIDCNDRKEFVIIDKEVALKILALGLP